MRFRLRALRQACAPMRLRPALAALGAAAAFTMPVLTGCHGKEEGAAAVAPPVSVITLVRRDAPFPFEFVGQTQSSHQVEIVARVNGFLEKRLYDEGSMVKAGQTLFMQDQRPFIAQLDAAKAALAEQQARLTVANDNLARVKPLAARNALSQKDLDDATGAQQAATAAVAMAKANVEQAELNLSYTVIKTPVSGASSFARVQDGQYVDTATGRLTYVAQLDPMWVDFSVSENDLIAMRREQKEGRLKLPPKEDFSVEVKLADGSLFPGKGRITFANADYNQRTGTFLFRATLPNPDGTLRPGQFVTVRVLGAVRPNAIVVPQPAVLEGAHGHFVVLVDKEHRAQLRPVEVGPWLGDDWFINSGLEAGEVLVVNGMAKLAPNVPVRITDEPAAAEGARPPGSAAASPGGAKSH